MQTVTMIKQRSADVSMYNQYDPDRNRIVTQLRKLICDIDEQKIQCCPINMLDDQIKSKSQDEDQNIITITNKVLLAIL